MLSQKWLIAVVFLTAQILPNPFLWAAQQTQSYKAEEARESSQNKITDLTHKMTALKQQEQTTAAQIQKLKSMLAQSKSQEAELSAQEQSLQKDYASTQNQVNQLQNRYAAMQSQMRQLENEGNNLVARARGVNSEAAAQSFYNDGMNFANRATQLANSYDMQNTESQLRQSQNRLSTLSNQQSQVRSQRQSAASRSQQLTGAVQQQNNNLLKIRDQESSIEQQLNQQRTLLENLKADPNASPDDIAQAKFKLEEMEKEFAGLHSEKTTEATPEPTELPPLPAATIEPGGTPIGGVGITEGHKLTAEELDALLANNPEAREMRDLLVKVENHLNELLNEARAMGFSFGNYKLMIDRAINECIDELFNDIVKTGLVTTAELAISPATLAGEIAKHAAGAAYHGYESLSLYNLYNRTNSEILGAQSGIDFSLAALSENKPELERYVAYVASCRQSLADSLNVPVGSIPKNIGTLTTESALTPPISSSNLPTSPDTASNQTTQTNSSSTGSGEDYWPYDTNVVDLRGIENPKPIILPKSENERMPSLPKISPPPAMTTTEKSPSESSPPTKRPTVNQGQQTRPAIGGKPKQ